MTVFNLSRLAGLFGLALFAVSAAAQPSAANTSGDAFTLNLKDADIKTLIATVSEVTGRNFVVDPRVKGEVTVLSNQPMTPKELYETFLSVLDVHGFAAVPSGEVTKIIPQINAKQNGQFGRAANSNTAEDIVTRVIHVDNVPAAQLVPILRPLVPQYGHLAAYSAANTLIVSDRKSNIRRIAEIVDKIDRNGMQDVEQIKLDYANAAEVAQKLKELKAGANGKGSTVTSFNVIADERTNSLLLSGDRKQRLRLRAIIADLDTETKQTGGTNVIYLDYADAETIAPVLQDYLSGQKTRGGNKKNNARTARGGNSVIAEPGANALVVTAPADKMQQLRKVIAKLDIRRGQVLVEAIIAEVSLTRSRRLGINLAAFEDGGPAAASILDSQTFQAVPALAGNGTPLSLIQQGLNVAVGNIKDQGTSFAFLVKALSGDSNTNVLSTPSLITRDNEEAEIKVGQEVPFVTGNFTNNNAGGGVNGVVNPFQTVERKDVGLTLSFTPQISKGETIQMDIDQEVSSIAQNSGTSGAVDLITNNRTLTTSVEVESGQILVLGGLIDNTVNQQTQKVPILGDIPLLGALFRFQSVNKNKRNLLNFIRPTIVRGQGKGNYYTRQKYDYIRALQQREANKNIPLMSDQQRPQLPPMDEYSQTRDLPGDADRRDERALEQTPGPDAGTGERAPREYRPAGGKRRGDQFGR